MKRSMLAGVASMFLAVSATVAQQTPLREGANRPDPRGLGAPEGQPGPRFFGPGGRGGPMQQERKLLKQFDANGDKWLNKQERQAAREFLQKERAANPGGRGFGPWGGMRGGGGFGPATRPAADGVAPTTRPMRDVFGPPGGPGGGRGFGPRVEPSKPGPRVSPADVKSYPDAGLYDPTVLRTVFLEFENPDWEAELTDFHGTDVDVAATLTVDGKKYPNVGVHFRGMSSYMMIPQGSKRSLNVSLDLADGKQRLYGYKTLNLLNSHEDPTLLHTVLYSQIARNYIPVPKANHVKLVINGESWGIYVNVQQFNAEFVKEWYPNSKGARWKVPGSPGGGGGLTYLGDDIEAYKRRYEIKTKDDPKDWQALVTLCRILNQTSDDKLEEALKPILDVDGVLWFLALDNVLCNGDGYWVRDSDYNIYLDDKGKFHIIPHDVNETFHAGGGPGGFGGPGGPGGFGGFGGPPRDAQGGGERRPNPDGAPGGGPGLGNRGQRGGGPRGGGGVEVDPLIGLNSDPSKPLRSKLLLVPAFKARYLEHVRTLTEQWLDWNKLEPIVKQQRALIEKEIEADTRKLDSYDAFKAGLGDATEKAETAGPRRSLSLKEFVEQRRKYLLNHPEIKKTTP